MPALAALLPLLPGLLVVRAPWTAVPALSLAFWVLSIAWLPRLSRLSLLHGALTAFAVLLVLRLLPKHVVAPPPGSAPAGEPPDPLADRPAATLAGLPSLLVLVAAVAVCATAVGRRNAPGPELAFQTSAARLVLWRDGQPTSAEPLLPLAPFGAHAPAAATLSADLSALSGLDVARSVAVVLALSVALVLVGLFALALTRVPAATAALASVLGLALVQWPYWLSAWGAGAALLALAFLLPAAALLTSHASRSSGVAAATLFAAGALAQPLLACCFLVVCGFVLGRSRRAVSTGILAFVLAGPGLLPLVRALSAREVVVLAASVRASEVVHLLLGGLVLALAPWALAAASKRPAFSTALGQGPRRRSLVLAAACLGSLCVLVFRVDRWVDAGQLTAAELRLLDRAAAGSGPLDAVCAPPGLREWVPAIASRAPGDAETWVPVVYADEWRARNHRTCLDLRGQDP